MNIVGYRLPNNALLCVWMCQWVNGMQVMSHSGGHLPFEAQVNSVLNFTSSNRITVAVNNTLTPHTLPPGSITYYNNSHYPPGYFVQNYQFDFFNYAGIHRHIQLYTTPLRYIDDITVNTDFSRSQGFWSTLSLLLIFLPHDASCVTAAIAMATWLCVCHVDVLCRSNWVDHHSTFTKL